MAQILPRTPGIGELFGKGLGQGLGSGLNKLAENKINQMFQRQQQSSVAQGLTALGFPQEQATQISILPPELQSVIVKNYLQGAETAGLDQALAGILGSGSEQVQQQEDQGIQQLLQQQVAPQQQQRGPELTGKDALLNAIGEYQNRQQPQQQLKAPTPTPLQQQQPKNTVEEILKRPRLSPEHKLKVAALQQQRQMHHEKISAKEQEEVSKETKPYYDEISKKADAAKQGNIRLARMEQLIEKGELSTPAISSIIDNLDKIPAIGPLLGSVLRYFEAPGTEEFRKLQSDFVKNAKEYFGSRLTDADLKVFMQTIPSVSQSREGKRRVINNLKSFNEIDLLRSDAADKIIEENGGRRPRNLKALVEKRIAPHVDAIAERFKTDPTNTTPSIVHHIPILSQLYRGLTP